MKKYMTLDTWALTAISFICGFTLAARINRQKLDFDKGVNCAIQAYYVNAADNVDRHRTAEEPPRAEEWIRLSWIIRTNFPNETPRRNP